MIVLLDRTLATRGSHNLYTINYKIHSMTQPSQNDPEWIALRARHRQECDAFIARQREFYLRMKAEQAELLARHQQQEGIFWLQPNHVAPSTYNLVPNTPQSTAANVQPTISNLSVSLGDAPYQRPLPTPGPSRKQSFSASSTPSLDVCDSQQQAAQQLKQLHGFAEAQRQSNKQIPTASTKPLQPLKSQPRPNVANTAPSARAALKKQHEIVDLCSDDDDVLVEVTGATYQQKTKPMIAPATFRPSIPTTTPQLPGKGSQKQSVSVRPQNQSILVTDLVSHFLYRRLLSLKNSTLFIQRGASLSRAFPSFPRTTSLFPRSLMTATRIVILQPIVLCRQPYLNRQQPPFHLIASPNLIRSGHLQKRNPHLTERAWI